MRGRSHKFHRHKPRNPKVAFGFLVSQANRKDLSYLLEFCAGVSAIAGLTEAATDPLARSCHYQVSRILLDAVLQSNASTEYTARPRKEDLSRLVNGALDVSHYSGGTKKLSAASGTPSARLEFMRFLAQLGQVQIAPFEHHPTVVAGRAVALIDAIPVRRRREIEARVSGASRVLDLPAKQVLGISARQAANVYFLLLKRYADLWHQMNMCLSQDERRVAEALPELDRRAVQGYWRFTPRSLTGGSGLLQTEIKAFLHLFARTPEELRKFAQAPNSPIGLGHSSFRMLPLDRYPVVAFPGDQYVVPNITVFRNAFPHVLDFSLLDAYRQYGIDDLYNQVRGAALELYLEDLISDRLHSCVLIPETEYRTSVGGKKSPDLCILDIDDKSLITVEAKARRLSPATAVSATNSDLDRNHGPSVEALRKLPAKIEDLRTNPEFRSWQRQLAQIPKDRTILVSIVATTLFFHDELEPLRARFDSGHPLARLEQPFCFLDLSVFETAVETARVHQIPLGRLLREHYEDTRAGDPNTPAARQFRNREAPEPSDTFAWRFILPDS